MIPTKPQWLIQFERKHGKTYVIWHDWKLYPDGARRENVFHESPALMEPPTDPIERQRLLIAYREKRLEKAIDQFDAERDSALRNDNAHWQPEKHLRELDRLAKIVRRLKKRLMNARQVLNEIDPAYVSANEMMRQAAEAAKEEERRNEFEEKVKSYQF